MIDIEGLFTPAEAKQMRLRAESFANLTYAVKQQTLNASGFRDQHVAYIIRICRLHGLTEAEIKTTIQQAQEEAAA